MKSIQVMQPGGYYLISYKLKTSVNVSSVQMKEKYLKVGLREVLHKIIIYIYEKVPHMLPRCIYPPCLFSQADYGIHAFIPQSKGRIDFFPERCGYRCAQGN